jgi:hypothetical protein
MSSVRISSNSGTGRLRTSISELLSRDAISQIQVKKLAGSRSIVLTQIRAGQQHLLALTGSCNLQMFGGHGSTASKPSGSRKKEHGCHARPPTCRRLVASGGHKFGTRHERAAVLARSHGEACSLEKIGFCLRHFWVPSAAITLGVD